MPGQNMSDNVFFTMRRVDCWVTGSNSAVCVWLALAPMSPSKVNSLFEDQVRILPLGRTDAETGTFGSGITADQLPLTCAAAGLAWAARHPAMHPAMRYLFQTTRSLRFIAAVLTMIASRNAALVFFCEQSVRFV